MTEHGYAAYASRHHPCRCQICCEANTSYHRAYRAQSDAPLRAVRRYAVRRAQARIHEMSLAEFDAALAMWERGEQR